MHGDDLRSLLGSFLGIFYSLYLQLFLCFDLVLLGFLWRMCYGGYPGVFG